MKLVGQKSIKDLGLNIQLFAREGDPNDNGGEPGGESIVKFGNVQFDTTGLSDEQVAQLAEVQKTYINGIQYGQQQGQRAKDFETELNQMRSQQQNQQQFNQNQQQQTAIPQQFVEQMNKMQFQMNDTQVAQYKAGKYQQLVAQKGQAFADEVMNKAQAEFDKRTMNDANQRTVENFDTMLTYSIGEKMSQPVEGMYNINNPEDVVKMLQDPVFKERMSSLQQAQQQGMIAPPNMTGNNQSINSPMNRENIRERTANMSMNERRDALMKDMQEFSKQNAINNFINKF